MAKNKQQKTKRKYTPRPFYLDGETHKIVSSKNPPKGARIYIAGKQVGTVGEEPPRLKKITPVKNLTEKQLQKREQNLKYITKKEAQRKAQSPSTEVSSSQGTTTFEFLGTENIYKKIRKEKERTYETKVVNGQLEAEELFGYNPKLYKENAYYSKEKQKEIVELFDEANARIDEIQETLNVKFSNGFHLYQSDRAETVEKKVAAALDVLRDDYVKDLALSYKLEFLSSFANHVVGKDYEEFVEAITEMDDILFLRLIRDEGLSYMAYSIQSELDTMGIEHIYENVRHLTSRAREWKKR